MRPVAQEMVVVGGVVVRGVEELLELPVGDGRAVDVIGMQMQSVEMGATRRVLPGILNVDAGIVAALDFEATDGEVEIAFGDFDHAGRRRSSGFGRGNLDDGLRHRRPRAGIIAQRFAGALGHERKKFM